MYFHFLYLLFNSRALVLISHAKDFTCSSFINLEKCMRDYLIKDE